MKILAFVAIVGFMHSAAGSNMLYPEIFHSAPSNLYIPQGFDNNDNVEIFFEGLFKSACYKVGLVYYTIDHEHQAIYITNDSYFFRDSFCAAVIVPYKKSVKTGRLKEGNYRVLFRHSRGNFVQEGVVPVSKTMTSRPDDFLYAPVENIKFHKSEKDQPAYLELSGRFFNTCMRLDFVKVNFRNDSNVIDVLPIAKMDQGACENVPEGIEFTNTVKLYDLRTGRFLIHTRALNGQSVNEIVTIR